MRCDGVRSGMNIGCAVVDVVQAWCVCVVQRGVWCKWDEWCALWWL